MHDIEAQIGVICPNCDATHPLPHPAGRGDPFSWQCPECNTTNESHLPRYAAVPEVPGVQVLAEWTCGCGWVLRKYQREYFDEEAYAP